MGKRIVLLAVPPVDELDLVGPAGGFGTANRLRGGGPQPYTVEGGTTTSDRRGDGGDGRCRGGTRGSSRIVPRGSPSIHDRPGCGTGTSTPRPESPPGSTSPSPGSKRTSAPPRP